ncbi:recombinase family protein [Streptomyces sp. NBC_01298]|uniref:recombinase family protein n=1 Tax=Streptomyces sp. NBC_01298 TaxID=2903817 RepID=UPI002E0F09F5
MSTSTLARSARQELPPTRGMNKTTDGLCPCHGRPYVDLLLRKSKIVREGERALSIRAQEDRGRAWADEHGYCVRKIWRENLSAWSDVQRPKYDAAMTAVLAGEVPALWCYALDRFSRKGAEAVVPILGKARVIFDYERLDSLDERDRRWIIDRAENAREYSQRLSYNVRGTKSRQRTEGKWLSKAPFGLVAVPGTRKLIPDLTPYMCTVADKREVTPWEIVQRVFKAIGEGMSSRALTRKLNSEGLRTGTGVPWRADAVRAIIIHPVYEGWLTHCPGGKAHRDRVPFLNNEGERVRVVTDETLPNMIPSELAERARRVLSGNQTISKAAPTPGRAVRALTSRMRCASCGSAMTLEGDSYACTRYGDGAEACADPAFVTRKAVEKYVVQTWSERLAVTDDEDPLLVAVAERWQAITRPEETQVIRDARAELKAAQAKLDKFHADDANDFYTGRSARYRIPHKNAAEARISKAETALAELVGNTGPVSLSFLLNGNGEKYWNTANASMQRDLLGLAIDTVTVTKSPGRGRRFDGMKRVTITWATPEGAEPDADGFEQAA